MSDRTASKGGRGVEAVSLTKAPARILIVEDDWIVATVAERALFEAGHKIVGIAYTAQDAFNLAQVHRPELILFDIKLSTGTDGVDAALKIMQKFAIRPLFVSAHADNEDVRERAKASRPLGWLNKPFTTKQLLNAVDLALHLVRAK